MDMTAGSPDYVKRSEWLLCERCYYSWLRDPLRERPTRCPECSAAPLVPVRFGSDDE